MPAWHDMFAPTVPAFEIVVRGTLLYLGVVFLARVTGQRESGGLTTNDLIVVILVGGALTQSMSTGYLSIPEGLILASTFFFWSVTLDAVSYAFPRVGALIKSRPRPLIEEGEVNRRALRREFLTREELDAQLRLQGIDDINQVRRAYLEPNGMISVFKRDDDDEDSSPQRPETL